MRGSAWILAWMALGCGEVLLDRAEQVEFRITLAGDGRGTVRTNDGSIVCEPDCTERVPILTELNLVADPGPGSVLAGWSAGHCVGTNCRLVVDRDVTLTATFEPAPTLEPLGVTTLGPGLVDISEVMDCEGSCESSFAMGATVRLEAKPLGAAVFLGWGGDCEGRAPVCQLVMSQSRTVTAEFAEGERTLSIALDGSGSGVVRSDPRGISCPPDCASSFRVGQNVALTATPDTRSEFIAWSLAECRGRGPCTLSLSAGRSVVARFENRTVALSVTKNGPGRATILSVPEGVDCGSECRAEFAVDSTVRFTAAPDPNSRLAGWSSGCTGAGDCVVMADMDRAIQVQVERRPRISAGGGHTCALRPDGSLHCWGLNQSGQLGVGTTTNVGTGARSAASSVVGLADPTIDVCAGGMHTCALLENGQVRCWGRNFDGQLGLGHVQDLGGVAGDLPIVHSVPLQQKALEIACGSSHTCALLASGAVRCWGRGDSGQLGYGCANSIGDGSAGGCASLNDDVPLSGSAVSIDAGGAHTCALMVGGAVQCWGNNEYGQLGYGHRENVGDDASDLMTTLNISSVEQIVAGLFHTCARMTDGTVRCWGRNERGQLGYGHTNDLDSPPADAVPMVGNVRSIETFDNHTCALHLGGSISCWGYNLYGQIGVGHVSNVGDDLSDAVATVMLSDAVAVTTGGGHSCALLENDDVFCWGLGSVGQLGTGATYNVGDSPSRPVGSGGPVGF